MKPEPFITLDHVTVRLGGAWPLSGISWEIGQGENWIVWGANGAGKTTLAKTLLGQAHVVKGSVHRHCAHNAPKSTPHDDIALVSSDQLFDMHRREQLLGDSRHFSGKLNDVTLAGDVLPTLRGEQPLAQLLRLQPLITKPLLALSAGEMRRLLIGRAMLRHPRLLILDEPFNGLDSHTREELLQMLNGLPASGTQMVLITHRRADIVEAFTHLLHLEEGSATWCGPVKHFNGAGWESSQASDRRTDVEKMAKPGPDGSGTPIIEMRGVHVAYGTDDVLTNIQWTMRSGENWAIVGPNGAGKSTLLKLITGDNLQGYANDLILFGRPKGTGESIWEVKQRIGYIGDDLQIRYQKKMTGFDVICSGFFDSVGLYRLCSHQQKEMASQWIEKAGVAHLAERTFSRLSFGQQRLILILRAMVKTPRLLILDEPCNGLDTQHRALLLRLLDIIGGNDATNLLYVSHRDEEMPGCITHRLHLANGQVVDSHAHAVDEHIQAVP